MRKTRLAISALSLLYSLGMALGQETRPATTDFATIAVKMVNLLAGGQFKAASAMMDPSLARATTPELTESTWASATAGFGAVKSIGKPRVERGLLITNVFVPVEWEHHTGRLKVVFNARRNVVGYFLVGPGSTLALTTRPAYLEDATFEEREVVIDAGGWKLPGRLTLPRAKPVAAAMVLVHGSGPHDADETLGKSKPFRDLAHGLAGHGVATLRYVKRTKAHPLRVMRTDVTVQEEVIDDALAAVTLLREHERTAGVPVYVLGHSLGGMCAPEIARQDGELSGIILMAAPAREFEDVLLDQFTYLHELGQLPDPMMNRMRDSIEALRQRELGEKNSLAGMPRDYLYDLCDRDGQAMVELGRRLPCRILVLQGGRDYQSTREDFDLWKDGLAGHHDARLRFLPEMNHLFARGKGKATPEEYLEHANYVDPEVIEVIGRWCGPKP